MRYNATAIAVALGLATSVVASPALAVTLANGSFEIAPAYTPAPPAIIPGWTTIVDGVEWFQPLGYLGDATWGPAHSGVSVIDLAWDPFGVPLSGGIEQIFGTVSGQQYNLSFYGVNRTGYGRDGTGIANVSINGNPLASAAINHVANGWTAADWQHFSYAFTATGASTTLRFTNAQNANEHFAFIDSVSVTAVPEPASWAMMLLGFAAVGFAMRRGRREPRVSFA